MLFNMQSLVSEHGVEQTEFQSSVSRHGVELSPFVYRLPKMERNY